MIATKVARLRRSAGHDVGHEKRRLAHDDPGRDAEHQSHRLPAVVGQAGREADDGGDGGEDRVRVAEKRAGEEPGQRRGHGRCGGVGQRRAQASEDPLDWACVCHVPSRSGATFVIETWQAAWEQAHIPCRALACAGGGDALSRHTTRMVRWMEVPLTCPPDDGSSQNGSLVQPPRLKL